MGCREDAHVGAGLGDDHVGDAGADSRDGAGQVPEGLKGFDHHLDPGGELIDLTLLSHLVNEASVAGRAGEGESLTHGLKAPIHGSRGALHPDADLRAHRHHEPEARSTTNHHDDTTEMRLPACPRDGVAWVQIIDWTRPYLQAAADTAKETHSQR